MSVFEPESGAKSPSSGSSSSSSSSSGSSSSGSSDSSSSDSDSNSSENEQEEVENGKKDDIDAAGDMEVVLEHRRLKSDLLDLIKVNEMLKDELKQNKQKLLHINMDNYFLMERLLVHEKPPARKYTKKAPSTPGGGAGVPIASSPAATNVPAASAAFPAAANTSPAKKSRLEKPISEDDEYDDDEVIEIEDFEDEDDSGNERLEIVENHNPAPAVNTTASPAAVAFNRQQMAAASQNKKRKGSINVPASSSRLAPPGIGKVFGGGRPGLYPPAALAAGSSPSSSDLNDDG